MIRGGVMRLLLLAPFALLAACGGPPADPTAPQGNGAAAPAPGQPDNRIDCKPAGAPRFERACTVDSAESREGRILTVRKADGGFRRLLIDRGGDVWAADGAEEVTRTPIDGQNGVSVEVEIGGDRFRLGPRWGVHMPREPVPR